jgi:ABC-type lipoprotein export system ATPase subunit
MSTLVSIRDLHKVYFRGNERIDVLQGVTLDIPEGDFLALMGPSGSGKTTLLNLMGGLDTPSEGSIQVAGDRIDKLSGSKLSNWRARHIGFVFQMYNLLPVLTAARNVELPLLLTRLGSADRKRRVQVALNVRRARRAGQSLPAPAVGRPGAARRHRPRHRHRPDAAAVRRADRRPRSQGGRRDPRAAHHAQS